LIPVGASRTEPLPLHLECSRGVRGVDLLRLMPSPISASTTSKSEPLTRGFPEVLGWKVGNLVRELAHKHELDFISQHAEVLAERDALRAEIAKLRTAMISLSVTTDGSVPGDGSTAFCTDLMAEMPRPPVSSEVPEDSSMLRGICSQHGESSVSNMGRIPLANSSKHDLHPSSSKGTLSYASSASSLNLESPSQKVDLSLLRIRFKELDIRNTHRVSAEDVITKMTVHKAEIDGNDIDTEAFMRERLPKFKEALEMVNSKWPQFYQAGSPLDEITFGAFQKLMLYDNRGLEEMLGNTAAVALSEIRDFAVQLTTRDMIATRTQVHKRDLSEQIDQRDPLHWMDTISSIVILFNAIAIGVSEDVASNWVGWAVLEICCTLFFMLELCTKFWMLGALDYFLGQEWAWHWFDVVIVSFAIIDCSLMVFQIDSELNNFTLVRLARLLRITRLVRLLRMKAFKELALMVNGVIGGLKTLFWAFIFLFCIVYVLGVFIRQVTKSHVADVRCDISPEGDACRRSQDHLNEYNRLLFSSVLKSMLTVFRCFVDGCESADGTPLLLWFIELPGGGFFVIGYVFSVIFVVFGVFNLITAVFTENTLEYARIDQQKRQQVRHDQHLRVAQDLHKIVVKICNHKMLLDDGSVRQRGLRRFMQKRNPKKAATSEDQVASEYMNMQVSREVFEDVMHDSQVKDLLEDLDISVHNVDFKLFDIIDSNGSGSLDVAELVEGLMKLRGPADKGDAVCAALMVRSTQRQLARLEKDLNSRHNKIQANFGKLIDAIEDMRAGLGTRGETFQRASIIQM